MTPGQVIPWPSDPCRCGHGRVIRALSLFARPNNDTQTSLLAAQNEADIYPDFVGMAKSFGVSSKRVIRKDELRSSIRTMLDTPGPYLLEV